MRRRLLRRGSLPGEARSPAAVTGSAPPQEPRTALPRSPPVPPGSRGQLLTAEVEVPGHPRGRQPQPGAEDAGAHARHGTSAARFGPAGGRPWRASVRRCRPTPGGGVRRGAREGRHPRTRAPVGLRVNWLVHAASAAPQADPAALPGALIRTAVTGAAFPASRCDAFAVGGDVRGGRPAPSPRGRAVDVKEGISLRGHWRRGWRAP